MNTFVGIVPKSDQKDTGKIEKKEFEDTAYFEPFYLKDFHGVKKNKS